MSVIREPAPIGSEFVSVTVDGRPFGVPIARVQEVFVPERVTRVPLAAAEVAGLLNLRGRIVTAIDLRRRLHLEPRAAGAPSMALGVILAGESYALLVDAVSEVLSVPDGSCEACPAHLDARLAAMSVGVMRREGELLLILDVDRVLEVRGGANAA